MFLVSKYEEIMMIDRKHTRKVDGFSNVCNYLKIHRFSGYRTVTTPTHPVRGGGHSPVCVYILFNVVGGWFGFRGERKEGFRGKEEDDFYRL